MTKKELLDLIIEEIDPDDEVTAESVLEEIDEWDSLAAMAVVALAKKTNGKEISMEQVGDCTTVQDVLDLVMD